MPHNNFVIFDNDTSLYCTVYNTSLANSGWGNILNAVRWDTQEDVDVAISEWGQIPGERFIGKNPPPH